MTYPKAIVISAALIATAVAFAAHESARSALDSGGRYMVSSGNQGNAWAIDTATGEIRECGISIDKCEVIQEGWLTP